ncbi:glucosaminidase domain-containing protein, partial [Enterococcus faecalis]
RKNPQTEAFVAAIAEDARELGLTYGVYASVMIAQAILESGSGQSGLASPPYYNLFGIKGTSGSRSVSMMTAEDNGTGEFYTIQAAFRAYTG